MEFGLPGQHEKQFARHLPVIQMAPYSKCAGMKSL
jgi:hypothetical protein